VLQPADVEKAFDLDDQLRNVDAVIDRVFQSGVIQREPVASGVSRKIGA